MELRNKHYIIGLILLGIIVRLVAFQSGFFFENDVNLFQWWGQNLYDIGLSQFYAQYAIDDVLRDYPPGFMYYLYIVGMLSARFGWERLSTMLNIITFLPAMIADLGIGYMIYRVVAYGRLTKSPEEKAQNKADRPKDIPLDKTIRALIMSALWILNPAIILISSVWGQVESVFVIFLVASLLLFRERKIILSYLLFAIAIIIKAQALFIAPVYLYSAYSYFMDNKTENSKISGAVIARFGVAVGASIMLMVLLSLPFVQGFNIMPIVRQYTGGLGTYPWASVNAFNFWGLITNVGHGWAHLQTSHVVVGVIFVIALIIGSIAALHRDHTRYEGRHFFLIVGALFALIFIFSVRMHERYLFPALTFFLLYYAQTREKKGLGLYIATSVTFFFNCREVLRWLEAGAHGSGVMEASAPILSFANVVIGGVIIFMLAQSRWMGKPAYVDDTHKKPKQAPEADTKQRKSSYQAPPPPLVPSETAALPPPMKRKDWAFFFILIAVYSFVAFFRLGDFRVPQTAWMPNQFEAVRIDFGEVRQVSEVQYLMGVPRPHENPEFTLIAASADGGHWHHVQTFYTGFTDVFSWSSSHMNFETQYLQIRADSPNMRMQEIAFRGPDGELIPIYSISPNGAALVDEQDLVPRYRTFMNSAYFDEVYHPRAGYEFLHGLPVFENTHPQMGKNFIAMSVAAFGMTPFGWRFPGTLAGVLMVPLLYAFARLLFKSNDWALFAGTIFAFSFITFAQTRLATIDSYVTLFIIAMYFFMYRFAQGIERDSFRKKLVVLALCGVSVGLAVASKWQGLYAVLGLPIIFFPVLYRLYLQNRREATLIFRACFGFFIGIPLVIYILSYIPFVAANGGGGLLRETWSNQIHMYRYHANLDDLHPFSSVWWEWPLNLRPIWLYANYMGDGIRSSIASFGNPAVFWMGTVAMLYMIFYFFTQFTPAEFIEFLQTSRNKRRRSGRTLAIVTKGFDKDIAFLLVAFGAQYLPWVIAPRSLTWIYHFFPSVPFFVLTITWMFKHAIDRRPGWKPWAIGYAVLVVALFGLFYPVLSGLPVSIDFVQRYLSWLPRWSF